MIFDIMKSGVDVPGEMDFVANSAVKSVAVNSPAAFDVIFTNANGDPWFEEGDHILLTGAWIVIPFGFGQGENDGGIAPVMQILWVDALGNFTLIDELANISLLNPVNLCGPLEFPPDGLFIKTPVGSGRQKLVLSGFNLKVSQINLPAILEGETINVQVFLRVTHTKALSLAP